MGQLGRLSKRWPSLEARGPIRAFANQHFLPSLPAALRAVPA